MVAVEPAIGVQFAPSVDEYVVSEVPELVTHR
jgi:hypothetical protein